ncbi:MULTISPECIES: hypothetical protein [unclassified Mesorhizobium]|uniref:hypothetical protein n=1 Tax=unclassified Mesorhizobium TaxID=325217 RepID=UPI0011266A1B|nr:MULTISPECIES: hypothetical protein [unclassified Mesorhizobium]TPL10212.1 hypothetical protein FJ938_05760 [Mesorhizobium sp. B2-4-14]UCI30950.1 hypothetical protein FJW03_24695 [Mesorhizobium sp. B4-1-4]
MTDYTMPLGGGTLDLSGEVSTDGVSHNTNDIIIGSGGNDTIIAGPATEQYYTNNHGDAKLVQDNDTIVESQGTNNLSGGYGNDKFVFNINLQQSEAQLHTEYFHDGIVPTQTAGANTNGVWNSFLSNLAEWRAAEAASHGVDVNTDTTHVDYTFGAKNQQSGSANYDNSFTWLESGGVTTNTSTNYIHDFGNGNDSIALDVTHDAFAAAGGTITMNGSDTVIHIGSFDIVVLGVDQSAVEGHIAWAAPGA